MNKQVQNALLDDAESDEVIAQPPTMLIDARYRPGHVVFSDELGADQQIT